VLTGGHDRTKARLIILVAGQHILHAFRRLADDCAIISLAPNADCVGNCQAVRKTQIIPRATKPNQADWLTAA